MENVSVVVESKDDTYGVTRGTFVAEADTYGADKFWVVLKPCLSRSTWRRTRVMRSLARLRLACLPACLSQPSHAGLPDGSHARSLSVEGKA